MNKIKTKQLQIKRRKLRNKMKVKGDSSRPRLCVYKSLKHVYAQVIDDKNGNTLVSASDLDIKDTDVKGRVEMAKKIGELLAERCLEKEIKQVIFDRNGYKYHGIVKELADGVRVKGLQV